MFTVGVVEAAHGTACEAHGLEHFRVACVAVRDCIAGNCRLPGGNAETLRHDFADDGQNRQHERTRERLRAQHRMQEVDEHQIDRHPRQVEQGRRPLATQKAPDGIDVAAAFERFGCGKAETGHVDCHAVR